MWSMRCAVASKVGTRERSHVCCVCVSVAWLPLAGFLLPSSPLPQVAEAVGAGEVIGGSWSSILFSLDVAVGLWPLLREGLRSSRLRPGALTRPCAS